MSRVIGNEPLESLLAEFSAAGDNGGMSVADLVTKSNRGQTWVRGQLARLRDAGKLAVGMRRSQSISGNAAQTPVYRLK